MPTMELPTPTPVPGTARVLPAIAIRRKASQTLWQFLRFGTVGCLNTAIDLLVLNCLLWLLPVRHAALLVLVNSIAYAVGALNSFILNRYWTFRRGGRTNLREVARFILTTLAAIVCNDVLMMLLNGVSHPGQISPALWTNISKIFAIGGTILVSYLSMRLWVFVQFSQEIPGLVRDQEPRRRTRRRSELATAHAPVHWSRRSVDRALLTSRSLSLVLPAYNEEQVIAATVEQALYVLAGWLRDFEVIVVNDGSIDRTGAILADMSAADARIRVITHERNRGYGATLVDGFAAATKELTFFMDSDGQFDIHDLQQFLSLSEEYNAVIGYRVQRRDTWMRKLNAWGWKLVIRLALGVRVRDVDCAFKVLRTDFLHDYPLETRGAMINAELLYKLKRAGCTIKEVGVRHLPRQGGRATGANLRVIARAFRELFLYARKWRREECVTQILSLQPEETCSGYLLQKENAMLDTNTVVVTHPSELEGKQRKSSPLLWQQLALVLVMLTSVFMNFYNLGRSGFGNLFYAAGVRSMGDNLHNFFFVSYDPGGFVTIDKPPLGFWLQTISVKLFGFTPFSIFLPQALAGVLAVLLLFHLVRRHFGFTAGLLAALALAVSPLSVVTNRNNTIDSTLAFVLLLSAWAIMRAAETGKWRWLLLSAVLIGVGFNVKMMEAYLVVPAFGLLYLLAAPCRLWLRVVQLLVAVLVLLAVSLSWAIAVDLTPASQRPYVGSSKDNSEISLAFGYNGVDRLLGRFGFGGNRDNVSDARQPSSTGATKRASAGAFPFPGTSSRTDENARRTGGRAFGSDASGPLRLFNEALGGQISWLLPIALLGLLALAWQRRPRFQQDRQQQGLLLWGIWLLTMGAFFSIASFFHQYYMTIFAPAICALFGIGVVLMWQDYRRSGWRGWLLPLALVATGAEQIHFITSNLAWGAWLIPPIAVSCLFAALTLCFARLVTHLEINPRVLLLALGMGLAALLLTPAVWSALPGVQNTAISTPTAGPARQYGFGGNTVTNTALINYLEANEGDAKYLVATPSSMTANTIILATNRPVMAMGGFGGSDPILTPSQLASLVGNGTVRFFLLNNPARRSELFGSGNRAGTGQNRAMGFFWFGGSGQTALTNWVTRHCTAVPANKWQSTANRMSNRATLLYDCAAGK